MKKPKQKRSYHPSIAEAAQNANAAWNKHAASVNMMELSELALIGSDQKHITVRLPEFSPEFSEWLVDAASIIIETESLNKK